MRKKKALSGQHWYTSGELEGDSIWGGGCNAKMRAPDGAENGTENRLVFDSTRERVEW